MKIKFSNVVKMFLAGACFVAVGCTDYGQDIENLNNRIDALETDKITPLETDLAAVKSALETAKKDLQDKIKANADAIEELEGALADLEAKAADYEEHKKAYEALVQSHKTKIATLEGEIAALKAKDTELAGLITALDAQVKQNKQDIADNKALLESTIITLNLLQDAHTALATKVDGLEAAFAKHQADIRKELDEHYAAFTAYTKKTDDALADLVAKHEAQKILIEANQKAIDDTNKELANAKKELEESIAATNKALADYKLEMADIIKGLEDDIEANGKAIKVNEKAIQDLQGVVGTLSSKVDTIEKNLNELTDKVNKFIESATKDIEALKGRIQSLVFVPEHKDGKATIHWAQLGSTLVEAQSVLKFQVSPAECAEALTNAEDLSFVFTEALASTRTNVPALNVVSVAVADVKKGIIAVTVNARNLGQSFYDGDTNYAVSLVLENESVNIASSYVHLAPATVQAIDVELVNNTADTYEIQYTDLETKHVVLPEHKFAFTVNGAGAYSVEEMIANGYDVVVVKNEPAFEFVGVDATTPNVFKNEVDYTKPYVNLVTVSLASEAKAAVNSVENVTYSYIVSGKTLKATASVKVTKIKRKVEMVAGPIVWKYEEDAASDAGLTPTASKDLATIVSSTLPSETTYADVLAVAPYRVTVSVDGAHTNDVTAVFAAQADGTPVVLLNNFVWGKKYSIEALYELESIDVVILADVETVDRVREDITINLDEVAGAPAQWTLTKDFVAQSETAADSLTALYEKLVENKVNTHMGEAQFLVDIFNNHDLSNVSNLVNENTTELPATKLVISDDAATIKSVYNVTEFEVVPAAVNYTYTVTTWYGQKITFTKTLNIGLQPVELTLNPESKNLVKDLVFTTTPEALAEIRNKVAHVDASFTADEYLTAIFVTNALREKIESANGIVLANTKLSVAAEGLTASASYSYENFSVTPKTVEYESNYTTWYGQEITIKKVVTIDWTTYNYVHVPEFVYNSNGYFSMPKAYRINNPATSSLLESVIISLDMDTAFNVVDKTNAIVNPADLGLTSTFDFTAAPADTRIKFLDGSNNLYYHGHDLTVGVYGQLVLTNSNGVKTVLPTNFDAGQKYADYYVKQLNLVGMLKSDNLDIKVSKLAKKYTYYVKNQLKLADDRGANLITRGELVKLDDTQVVYSNADWTVGNNANGFVNGVKVVDLYGLQFTGLSCTGIPTSVKDQLKFNETTGELYFDNTNAIELTTPIILKVKVDITHFWANDSVEFTVTLVPEK